MTTVLVASGQDHGHPGNRRAAAEPGESTGELRAQLESLDPAITVLFRQTDDEAELISWLHEAVEAGSGVVLNPDGFTHYSYALRDAAAAVTDAGLPLIEVHLTNPTSRDDFRRASVVSAVSTGSITGLGFDSYRFAVRAAADRAAARAADRAADRAAEARAADRPADPAEARAADRAADHATARPAAAAPAPTA